MKNINGKKQNVKRIKTTTKYDEQNKINQNKKKKNRMNIDGQPKKKQLVNSPTPHPKNVRHLASAHNYK